MSETRRFEATLKTLGPRARFENGLSQMLNDCYRRAREQVELRFLDDRSRPENPIVKLLSKSQGRTDSVLCLTRLSTSKWGSMEIYYAELASELRRSGRQLVLVLEQVSSEVAQKFEAAGAEVHTVGPLLPLRPGLACLPGWKRVAEIVRETRPQTALMHFFSIREPVPHALKLLGLQRVIYVDDVSGTQGKAVERPPWSRRAAYRVLIGPIDGAVGVSRYIHDRLRTVHGFPEERARCIYNGVSSERGDRARVAAELASMDIDPSEQVTLVVCAMIPEKGAHIAAEAFRGCPELGHLLLVGDGAQRLSLEASFKSEPHVHFLGQRSDVYDWMDRADVLIVPSLWSEAFGFAIAEGMMNELPVVASRVGAIPELIVDGQTGLLFEPGDADGLRRHLRKLAQDRELCRTFGKSGAERAKRLFTVDRMVAEVLDFVARVEAF